MIAELILIGKTLVGSANNEVVRSTPQRPTFRPKSTTTTTTPTPLGKPKTIAESFQDLPPQRIEDITVPERYFRRPPGLN